MAHRLTEAGAVVTAPRRGHRADDGPKTRERTALLKRRVRQVDDAAFGSDRFLELFASDGPFDVLCLHGATVGDHRAADFDVIQAVRTDSFRLGQVLDRFKAAGGRAVVATGTVFEMDEGRGEAPQAAIGGYGLAKSLTWQIIRHEAERSSLRLGKFVVPHPFGPMEKPGLTTMLAEAWLCGQVPTLKAPHLIRDHIHVDLLARAYARFVRQVHGGAAGHFHGSALRAEPSGHVETVASFTARFARAMGPLLGMPTRWSAACSRTACTEPVVRCNGDPSRSHHPEFDESRAYEELAAWYLHRFGGAKGRGGNRMAERTLELA